MGKSFKKYFVKGAVAKIHYNIEFIKHVFPILFKPTGLYPKPAPFPVVDVVISFIYYLKWGDSSFSSSI